MKRFGNRGGRYLGLFPAFSLAEILITLGVIGVVVALTMPSLVNSYEKKVTVERLKESYSMINQAVIASENDNGNILYWDYSSDVSGDRFFSQYLKPYLKGVAKKTGRVSFWKKLDGTIDNSGSNMYAVPRYMLPNGVYITVYSSPYSGVNLRKTSAWIIVDINGPSRPNRAGRDVFFMGIYPYLQSETGKVTLGIHEQCGSGEIHTRLTREKILTSGCATCKKDYTGAGYACGLLIQKDGWQIKDDYPW